MNRGLMQMNRSLFLLFSFLLILLSTSCVKDIDFDQAGNISLQPKIQASLLIFQVDQKDFVDPVTQVQRKVIRDTVRLEFLDDDYIQNDLEEVEFKFKFRNTFPQSFSNKISFLDKLDRLQHQVTFFTAAGNPNNAAVSEKIDLIRRDNIHLIKRSFKMVVEVEVLPGNEPFIGTLNFESKGLFSFQF